MCSCVFVCVLFISSRLQVKAIGKALTINKQDPKVTIDRQEKLKKGDYNASLFLVSAKTTQQMIRELLTQNC